jgi:hypothetical protein
VASRNASCTLFRSAGKEARSRSVIAVGMPPLLGTPAQILTGARVDQIGGSGIIAWRHGVARHTGDWE